MVWKNLMVSNNSKNKNLRRFCVFEFALWKERKLGNTGNQQRAF